MEFEFVLKQLLEGFTRLKIRYGATGGFALGALGAERTTKDLDFLVSKDDMDKVHELMGALKYRRVHHSENISQYQGETVVWGFVDFIHAYRPLALRMLADAVEKPIFSGAMSVRVLRPEDVIGLKVQAIANNPDRRERDEPDIKSLIGANENSIDWNRIEEYYRLFNLQDEFKALMARFKRA